MDMTHETAKKLLTSAKTPQQRVVAVKAAFSVGMPLNEIEQYLDWLDNTRLRLDATEPPEQQHSPAGEREAKETNDFARPDQQGE